MDSILILEFRQDYLDYFIFITFRKKVMKPNPLRGISNLQPNNSF